VTDSTAVIATDVAICNVTVIATLAITVAIAVLAINGNNNKYQMYSTIVEFSPLVKI
jgi:hypothetical protein